MQDLERGVGGRCAGSVEQSASLTWSGLPSGGRVNKMLQLLLLLLLLLFLMALMNGPC